MGVRNESIPFIVLAIVMLMLSQQDAATCFAAQVYYSDRFRPRQHHNGRRGNADYQTVGDKIFGDQKRRVYNGPNPLHNR
uniref:Uncharacterized protein n=1 Tax=Kalanchoe fedtschenkoi TaxID=63787 RepID=A0A7N0TI96_KALFE